MSDLQVGQSKEKVYKLRKRNFERTLVSTVSLLGYIVILLQYLKYGTRIWLILLRCGFQSLLSAPFPDEGQLFRMARATRMRGNNTGNENRSGEDTPLPDMPGAFTAASAINPTAGNETISEDDIEIVKKKIRTMLFHGSLTLNLVVTIFYLLYPVDFYGKLEGNYPSGNGLQNTPSPYNNQNDLAQGERRGTVFLQVIGEKLPDSNFSGNLGLFAYNVAIMFCQFTLFTLTCVNFGQLGYKEPIELIARSKISDGYDGNVLTAEIDYTKAINEEIKRHHATYASYNTF